MRTWGRTPGGQHLSSRKVIVSPMKFGRSTAREEAMKSKASNNGKSNLGGGKLTSGKPVAVKVAWQVWGGE